MLPEITVPNTNTVPNHEFLVGISKKLLTAVEEYVEAYVKDYLISKGVPEEDQKQIQDLLDAIEPLGETLLGNVLTGEVLMGTKTHPVLRSLGLMGALKLVLKDAIKTPAKANG